MSESTDGKCATDADAPRCRAAAVRPVLTGHEAALVAALREQAEWAREESRDALTLAHQREVLAQARLAAVECIERGIPIDSHGLMRLLAPEQSRQSYLSDLAPWRKVIPADFWPEPHQGTG